MPRPESGRLLDEAYTAVVTYASTVGFTQEQALVYMLYKITGALLYKSVDPYDHQKLCE